MLGTALQHNGTSSMPASSVAAFSNDGDSHKALLSPAAMMEHSHKRSADSAPLPALSWQPSRKRRAVGDAATGRSALNITAAPASPKANETESQRSACFSSLPPPFDPPPSPPDAAVATTAASPHLLLSFPTSGLLQTYEPLHARTPQLPYVPSRIAHVHSTTITHHDQPIYLSKLQDRRDRAQHSQRTPQHAHSRTRVSHNGSLTFANDNNPQQQNRSQQSRHPQADGGELLTSTAERSMPASACASPFKRRTAAERAVPAPTSLSPSQLRPAPTEHSQQSMASDDSPPLSILSPSFSSQSSSLPAVSTPPHAPFQQRRSSSLFSLSLSSSSSSSLGSQPLTVSRTLSFQLLSSSSSVSTTSFPSAASMFEAVSNAPSMPAAECEPVVVAVTPPPLVSKKTASYLRMSNRNQQQPLQTPSKDERVIDVADSDLDKENVPVSTPQQLTPRSHKDLFAVRTPAAHSRSTSASGRRGVAGTSGSEWRGEERTSGLRALRSMR